MALVVAFSYPVSANTSAAVSSTRSIRRLPRSCLRTGAASADAILLLRNGLTNTSTHSYCEGSLEYEHQLAYKPTHQESTPPMSAPFRWTPTGISSKVTARGADECNPAQTEEVPVRNVAVQMYMSVDGVMEAPEEWSFRYWTGDHEKYAYQRVPAAGALALGRSPYQGFAPPRPSRSGDAFAAPTHTLPQYA